MFYANVNVNLIEQNVSQISGEIMIGIDGSVKNISEKDYVWNPATCMYKNRKYLASIMDDSAVI